MIWILLVAHLVGVVAVLSLPSPRPAFAVALAAPLASAVWAASRLGGGETDTARLDWVEGLDLAVSFRVGPLGALLAVLVSGIGVLIFVYGHGYFGGGDRRGFAATLLAFSGSMLGLVWADDVWTLFLFWDCLLYTSPSPRDRG